MAKVFHLFFVVLALFKLQQVQSITEEDLKIEFTRYIMQCLKDYNVEMSEILSLQKYNMPKSSDAKCLLACAYKLSGTMSDKGLYDTEKAYELAERMSNGDAKRLENGKKLSDICGKEVNDAKVSDGEKGCERAAIMFKCGVENSPKLGFKLV